MKKITTYVLMVSKKFPGTHKRKGEYTMFPSQIRHGLKIHTIRGNYKLWKNRFKKIEKGEARLSLRTWSGKPYKSEQEEFLSLTRTQGIGIEKLNFKGRLYDFLINDKENYLSLNDLSANDGLEKEDFKEWFKKYDLSEPMAIIHFTDFRYSK